MALSKKQRLERLVEKIDDLLTEEERVDWLGPCAEKRIDKVEQVLDASLPKTYREFVTLKGGGGIEGLFIFGIPPKGPIDDGGAIGYFASSFREEWDLPTHLLPIQHDPDLLDAFCLDLSRTKRGECPIVHYALPNGETSDVAADFVSWYEEYANPYFAHLEQ